MTTQKKPGRGSERVKAWVYVVMNPLIDSFGREAELLKAGNLSWRVHSRRCEYILPVSNLIDTAQRPNLEDFLAENPTFGERFAAHDFAVNELERTIALFVNDLLASPGFQKRVLQSLEAYESSRCTSHPGYPDLSDLRSKAAGYVAEFIVNGATSLPPHYNLHHFWESFAERFQDFFAAFKDGPTAKASQGLMAICERLDHDLASERLTLCKEYDIPAAPIYSPRISSVENVLYS